MPGQFIVYGLTDPRDSALRYVGQSSTGLRRPRGHTRLSRKEDSPKATWIRGLLAGGLSYGIVILEEVPGLELLDAAEKKWIARARSNGSPLTNLSDGGCSTNTPAVRRQMSASARRRGAHSPEVYALVAKTLAGKPRSEEAKAKIAAGALARYADPAERRKTGDAIRAAIAAKPRRRPNAEARERLAKAQQARRQREAQARSSG